MALVQRVALIGFGAVGRAFARLLLRKREEILQRYAVDMRVTGIITARRGRPGILRGWIWPRPWK
jgi:homoserine dehydrogenase